MDAHDLRACVLSAWCPVSTPLPASVHHRGPRSVRRWLWEGFLQLPFRMWSFFKDDQTFFLATNRRLACCSLSSLPWVMYPSSVAMIPCCRVGTFHKISQSVNNYSLLRSKSHRRGIYIIMLFKGPHFKLGSWAVLFLGLQRIEIAACF